MKNLLLLSLCLSCWVTISNAQSSEALRSTYAGLKASGEVYTADALFASERFSSDANGAYHDLVLNQQVLQNLYAERPLALSMNIPQQSGDMLQLELVQVDLLKSGASFSIEDQAGITPFEYQPGLFYRGILKNATGTSWAAITVFDDGLMGMVATETGNWNLGPKRNDFSSPDYILFNDQDYVRSKPFTCYTPDGDPGQLKEKLSNNIENKVASNNCADVFFVVDNDLFGTFLGPNQSTRVWRTFNYVTALFNLVATIYQNENINIRLSGIRVWVAPDTYDESDSQNGLNSFESEIQSNFTGDVAMLLAIDNGNGGRAVLGFDCGSDDSRHGYCDMDKDFDADIMNYSWDTYVTAHELGHVLGSHHTHWCGWSGGPIDNCGPLGGYPTEGGLILCFLVPDGPTPALGQGTIMSYCHLVTGVGIGFVLPNGGFGTQPANAIISYIDGQGCLGACNCPADILTFQIPNPLNAATPPEMVKYEASNSVESNSVMNSGTFAKLDAGKFIRFTNGYWAKSGSTVHAYIEGCGWLDGTNGTGSRPRGPSVDSNAEKNWLSVAPNPTNAETLISFSLPAHTIVEVKILNLQGQLLQSWQLKTENSESMHTLNFDASQLPPGLYFCTLESSGERMTQKFVVGK